MSFPQSSIDFSSRDAQMSSLVAGVAGGDQQALSSLYDLSSGVVFGLCLRILSEHPVAEEVLLDVYMQIWRQAAQYDKSRGSPLAWILTIARSRAIDRLRTSRQEWQRRDDSFEVLAEKTTGKTDVEEEAIISEQQDRVRSALDALPLEQREVIELAYYGGFSHSEIALKLNQPLGTIKTRTRLGMMKLRDILQPARAELR